MKHSRQRCSRKVLKGKITSLVEMVALLFLGTQIVILNLMLKSKSSNTAKVEISQGLNLLLQALTISLLIAVSQVQHLFQKCKLYNKSMAQGFLFRWVNQEVQKPKILCKDHAPQFLSREWLPHYLILKLFLKSKKINS